MLDIRFVVEHLDEVRRSLSRRNPEAIAPLDQIAELAEERRQAIQAAETGAAQRNAANQDMAKLPKQSPEFAQRRDELKRLSAEIKELERKRSDIDARISEVLMVVPNLPDSTTPDGRSEADNPVLRVWGSPPAFDFAPKAHWDLGPELGIIDFERAAKLSGARFAVLMGQGAKLERALISFMLDLHINEHGYTEVMPPLLVKDSALRGTGQLPKFEADLFKTSKADPEKSFDLYLIPTAEVPVTNLHAEEILEGGLPIAYCAYTPCFRSEAGSYGKDVRGLIRQHQFNKVELVRFCAPEVSAAQHELLTSHAEEVLKRLGLHYRVISLCAGDLGFSAAKTFDLEVWLPGAGSFREISSCSNFSDFQARRASIRYRAEKGQKPQLVHTLNGSGLAIGRTLIAVLEQYQQADGSVRIPEALQPYMNAEIIRARDVF